jgi:hypothetical protein
MYLRKHTIPNIIQKEKEKIKKIKIRSGSPTIFVMAAAGYPLVVLAFWAKSTGGLSASRYAISLLKQPPSSPQKAVGYRYYPG